MAEPSKKSQPIESALESIFGRSSAIRADVCVMCEGSATQFKDELSRKEYKISGMCQGCQDKVFGV